jgi:plastocyanin
LSRITTSERRQRAVVSAAAMSVVALLLVTGCSASSRPAAGPAPITFGSGPAPGLTGTGTAGPAPISTPMPMPADSGAPSDQKSAAPQGSNAVNISNFAFVPATLTIPVGTTVTWTNKDEEPHTVVSNDGSTFHSAALGTDGIYSFTFQTAGTFDYVCSIHPMMHGTVVVTK